MFKRFNFKMLTALAVLAIFATSTDMWSQDFIMKTSAATYNATCGGVIKMKSNTGQIVNASATLPAVPNKLGTDEANAIKGVVDWADSITDGQEVQALYYERLVLSGGKIKTIPDSVFITGGSCSGFLARYDSLNLYPFYIADDQLAVANTFAGTFYYIGAAQTVYHVTDDDAYASVALGITDSTGAYTIMDGTTTTINGVITLPGGTGANTLDVQGDLFTGLASTLAGAVTVTNGGTINIASSTGDGLNDITFNGDVTLTNGSIIADSTTVADGFVKIGATSTLSLDTDGKLNFDNGTNLLITGVITNLSATGKNLLFNCGSTVTYDSTGSQTILPTIDADSNRYGNLVLKNGPKVGGTTLYGTNLNICTNFSLAGGNLVMSAEDTSYVQMSDGLARYGAGPTYTGTDEVVGGFRRKVASLLDDSTEYVYNNYQTSVKFATGGIPAGTYLQLNVFKDSIPVNYRDTSDVERKITLTYDLADGGDYTLKAGYMTDDVTSLSNTNENFESYLKFFEGKPGTPDTSEKVSGVDYKRDSSGTRSPGTAPNMAYVSLSSLAFGTVDVDGVVENVIKSGNDLILRATNTMHSIADGRWSNPNVWDEGRIPKKEDNIGIDHMIYVGIDAPFAGTSRRTGDADNDPEGNTRSEATDYAITPGGGYDAAAKTITIVDKANASLIIGNEDNGTGFIFKTLFAGTSFINNNTAIVPSTSFPIGAKGSFLDKTGFNGLWLTDYVTGTNPGVPTIGTFKLQNSGSVNNQGIIVVGE